LDVLGLSVELLRYAKDESAKCLFEEVEKPQIRLFL
jgi:hypothetical protein